MKKKGKRKRRRYREEIPISNKKIRRRGRRDNKRSDEIEGEKE